MTFSANSVLMWFFFGYPALFRAYLLANELNLRSIRQMFTPPDNHELIAHLCRHSRLTADEAVRLVNEVLNYYSEDKAGFIRRRHYELQKCGLSNSTIYHQIGIELNTHRFAAEPMTERQIRRTIYG